MSTTEIILLALAILATIYQVIKIAQVIVAMHKYVDVHIRWSFYFGMLVSVSIQALCVGVFMGWEWI